MRGDGDGWVVTTHNMHAWPELYFEDLGWVPFEPSPAVAGVLSQLQRSSGALWKTRLASRGTKHLSFSSTTTNARMF